MASLTDKAQNNRRFRHQLRALMRNVRLVESLAWLVEALAPPVGPMLQKTATTELFRPARAKTSILLRSVIKYLFSKLANLAPCWVLITKLCGVPRMWPCAIAPAIN